MRRDADPVVVDWVDTLPPESVWTSSITVFEIRFGILETGRRRRLLETAFADALAEDFDGRVLPFDDVAAQAAGRIAAERRRAGKRIEVRDVQIAGIAVARRASVATGNVRHFEGLGLTLIDPWSA